GLPRTSTRWHRGSRGSCETRSPPADSETRNRARGNAKAAGSIRQKPMVRYSPAVASDPKGDELGRTATDAASLSSPATPADPLGASVGRYRLERELG